MYILFLPQLGLYVKKFYPERSINAKLGIPMEIDCINVLWNTVLYYICRHLYIVFMGSSIMYIALDWWDIGR
jgi:hypothetical protein